MDLRKAALITWLFFWLASLSLLFINLVDLKLYEESGSIVLVWFFGNILNLNGLCLDPVIFCSWLDYSSRLPTIPCSMIFSVAIQAGFICFSAISCINLICTVGSVKIGIWLMIVSNLIKFIPQLILINQTYALRPTQVPRLSQPRHNLLANEPPTTLTPNFEDVEQPPPSYEEYLALGNDLPPKYEDLEEAPPAYQETML